MPRPRLPPSAWFHPPLAPGPSHPPPPSVPTAFPAKLTPHGAASMLAGGGWGAAVARHRNLLRRVTQARPAAASVFSVPSPPPASFNPPLSAPTCTRRLPDQPTIPGYSLPPPTPDGRPLQPPVTQRGPRNRPASLVAMYPQHHPCSGLSGGPRKASTRDWWGRGRGFRGAAHPQSKPRRGPCFHPFPPAPATSALCSDGEGRHTATWRRG